MTSQKQSQPEDPDGGLLYFQNILPQENVHGELLLMFLDEPILHSGIIMLPQAVDDCLLAIVTSSTRNLRTRCVVVTGIQAQQYKMNLRKNYVFALTVH